MIKTTFRIIKDKPSGANDLSAERTYLNKVWVDRDELIKTISKINKELYNDEFGLYDWNEVLLRELGVDE